MCNYKILVVSIIIGYLIGSMPFGLIFTKLSGHKDIRKQGSGNIGSTNVLRTTNKFLAFLTLTFDAGKGIVAIIASQYMCFDYAIQIIVGIASILGHVFPVWLRFKGGKGVATSLAVFAFLNWKVGLISCVIWIVTLAITRISAVSALLAFALLPVITYFITYDLRLLIAAIFVSILIIIRHKSNIKKLLSV